MGFYQQIFAAFASLNTAVQNDQIFLQSHYLKLVVLVVLQRVVVLAAQGKAFSAGHDLRDAGSMADHELLELEAKAARLGDYILAGHLLRDIDLVWS